jgi:hypothetical protein
MLLSLLLIKFSIRILPAKSSPSAQVLLSYLLLSSEFLLLFAQSLILPFVEKWSTHFLAASLNLFHQVELAHLLYKLLVLLLLLSDLLFFKLHLALLLFLSSLISIILLYLLDKESALHTPTSAVLPSTVLNQELSKRKVLLLSCLEQRYIKKCIFIQHGKLFDQ